MRTVGKLESEAGVGVALAKHSEIETVWIPPMEMIVGVRLEEDLVSIPPIGRKIPAKLDTVVGKHWVKHFGTCACCKVWRTLAGVMSLIFGDKKEQFHVLIRALIGCACVGSENITVYSNSHQSLQRLGPTVYFRNNRQ